MAGYIRELENLVRKLAALCPEDVISESIISAEFDQIDEPALMRQAVEEELTLSGSIERYLANYFNSFGDDLPPPGLYHRLLKELEYPLLTSTLTMTRGNQIKAAELLGVNRNTLRKKIRDLQIPVVRVSV